MKQKILIIPLLKQFPHSIEYMMIKSVRKLSIIVLVLLFPIVILFIKIFVDYNNKLEEESEYIVGEFYRTFRFEAERRLTDIGERFVLMYHEEPYPPADGALIEYDNGDTIQYERTDEYLALSGVEQLAMVLQSKLYLDSLYLKPEIFSEIFVANVNKNNLDILLSLRCIDNIQKDTIHVSNAKFNIKNSQIIKDTNHGMEDEVTIGGNFIIKPTSIILKYSSHFFPYIGGLVFLCVVFLSLGAYLVYIKYIYKEPELPVEEDKILLTDNCILYLKQNMLKRLSDGETVNVTPSMKNLLEILAKAENRCATYDEIIDTIWGKSSTSSNRMTQLIKRTREKLDPLDEIFIENVSNVGYKFTTDKTKSTLFRPDLSYMKETHEEEVGA